MPHIVTLHSYRGGTGKSTIAANVALLAAAAGYRVAVADTDIQTPGLHRFFGLGQMSTCRSLADYLVGKCEMPDAAGAIPIGESGRESGGALFVVPARSRINEVNEILMRGYDIGLLREGFDGLTEELGLDLVILDTHSGMANETVAAVAMSTSLLVITRADHLTTEVKENISLARRLAHPRVSIMVNMVPDGISQDSIIERAEQFYQSPVIAILPYSAEVAALGSDRLLVRDNPDHEIVSGYQHVAAAILAGAGPAR
jgi:MinD-like ATPase involved in chromosome partitioning or flagellar assembly